MNFLHLVPDVTFENEFRQIAKICPNTSRTCPNTSPRRRWLCAERERERRTNGCDSRLSEDVVIGKVFTFERKKKGCRPRLRKMLRITRLWIRFLLLCLAVPPLHYVDGSSSPADIFNPNKTPTFTQLGFHYKGLLVPRQDAALDSLKGRVGAFGDFDRSASR
eukprot:1581620-Rhodomonas_salina.4